MKSRVFLYAALFFAAVSVSCSKDDYTPEEEPEINKESTISYTVTVKEGASTRASLNGKSYIFQADDKLYVTDDNEDVHGILTLTAGAGTGSATFSGDLSYPTGTTPDPKLKLNATLVSSTDKIHDITTRPGFVNATTYPTSVNALASSLEQAVEWYSDFTGEGEYEERNFTLHQNSAFLNFTVKYVDLPETILDGSTESKTVTISFTNEDESGNPDPVSARSGSKVLKKEEGYIVTNFVAGFPGGTKLNAGLISVKVGDDGEIRSFYLTDATLAANKKYNVSRISSCEFSVLTRENNTTIKFNYVDAADGAQYKVGSGEWTAYDLDPNFKITVSTAGTVVMFRSKRAGSYENQNYSSTWPTAGGTPIFTFSKKVYVYGDIMSLKSTGSGDKYIIGNTIDHDHEFAGSFWGINNMEVPADRFLVLSAQNLKPYCYQNMFRQNTSITAGNHIIISASKMVPFCCNGMFKACKNFASAPVIKAEVLAESCCQSMFEDCNLTEVPALPATVLAEGCYRQMFRNSTNLESVPTDLLSHVTNLEPFCYFSMFSGCTSLKNAPDLPASTLATSCYETMFEKTQVTSIKCLATDISATDCTKEWFKGVTVTGTFTKKTGVTWGTGISGIPSGWTVVEE
ncbi:MAG: hypothetical protein IKS82_05490 [Bacteroidales bacterium]|nr:hypothetical protein [Bacteroidales bacterium]